MCRPQRVGRDEIEETNSNRSSPRPSSVTWLGRRHDRDVSPTSKVTMAAWTWWRGGVPAYLVEEWLNGQAYELRRTKAIKEQERREQGQPQVAGERSRWRLEGGE